jgi:3-deoxy-D-manno-octulosonic-acid transferase
VALINGRISITSFRRYQLIRPFVRGLLNNISIALMQSEQDAGRIRELGIPNDRVLMPGNLKFDSAESAIDEAATENLRRRFGFDRTTRLIVAASTHAPEEEVVIDAFKQIKNSQTGYRARLLIAPRHPERFGEVASLLHGSGLSWSRRSAASHVEDRNCEVILLDTIGELRSAYPLADVAFVGGSIAPHGGHNILEPSAQGVCVVTGAHMHNFAAITKAMLDEEAIVQMAEVSMSAAPAELAAAINALLSNDSLRRGIGRKASMVCDRNRGATKQTLQMIAGLLETPKKNGASIPLPALSVTAVK